MQMTDGGSVVLLQFRGVGKSLTPARYSGAVDMLEVHEADHDRIEEAQAAGASLIYPARNVTELLPSQSPGAGGTFELERSIAYAWGLTTTDYPSSAWDDSGDLTVIYTGAPGAREILVPGSGGDVVTLGSGADGNVRLSYPPILRARLDISGVWQETNVHRISINIFEI